MVLKQKEFIISYFAYFNLRTQNCISPQERGLISEFVSAPQNQVLEQ